MSNGAARSAPRNEEATRERAQWLVLDSAAFIAGLEVVSADSTGWPAQRSAAAASSPSLYARALANEVELYTLPEVLGEIRDGHARTRLEQLLPLVRSHVVASEQALERVRQFAKATGDYAALSRTDLQVLALACTLEMQRHGERFLKSAPAEVQLSAGDVFVAQPRSEAPESAAAHAAQLRNAENNLSGDAQRTEHAEMDASDDAGFEEVDGWTQVTSKKKPPKRSVRVTERRELAQNAQRTQQATTPSREDNSVDAVENKLKSAHIKDAKHEVVAANEQNDESDEHSELEDDGSGWIHPDNVDDAIARELEGRGTRNWCRPSGEEQSSVGTITTDFAMQNVLLQMGLRLVGIDGRRNIRQLRRYVMVCGACGEISRELERPFCRVCGHHAMQRVACSMRASGGSGSEKDGTQSAVVLTLYLNPKRPPRVRGTKYAVPKPKGGRNNNDLILSADMLELRQRQMRAGARKGGDDHEDSAFSPAVGYNASAAAATKSHREHSASGGQQVQVGYGRRNPNVVRHKTGSKKKNKK